MKRTLVGAWLLLAAPMLLAQDVKELVLEKNQFRLHSAFWPNLHHVLWAEAWARRPTSEDKPAGKLPQPLTANLTAAERRAWDSAVAYYDTEVAELDLLFEMGQVRRFLIAVRGELPTTGLAPEHLQALASAAPIYRKYWWRAHDRANRAWTAETMSKVASLSPVVPERLAKLYGTPWFTQSVRVDVVRVGAREGAYTSNNPQPAHITMSSSRPGMVGWMAAEVLYHEASHVLVRPLIDAFASELRAQGKLTTEGGIGSRTIDLWHVALFYATGEVVRGALAQRGVAYEPYIYKTGMFDRVWPRFRTPVETYWKPYVNGVVPREEAIKNVVTAIK